MDHVARLTNWLANDFGVLLAVVILVVLFAFYEIAGLTLPGWHTISYYAHRYLWVKVAITLGFIVGAAWFWLHASGDVPK